jgi:tetratricopeptide (TPR) repeat protein
VALFITRARAVRPSFSITNANAPAVAEICVRLDGLPLAIELAAARVRLYLPEQLLVRLTSDRLQTLTGGARDLPTRQQTIRSTIDWSYRLLTPAQQQVFARLGVFVGGWTAEAAAAVGGDDPVAVAEGLELLIEQSLVRLVETGTEPRYTMLETIRTYALEQLTIQGELAPSRQKHAAHFLALAETAQPHLRGQERGAWLDRLEIEHDNLRAALGWVLTDGDLQIGARITIALAGQDWDGLWFRMLHWGEGWRWLDAVLAQRDALTPRLHAWVLLLTAVYRGILDGNPFLAQRAVLDEALTLFRTAGDRSGIAYVLRYQGGYDAGGNGDILLVEAALALYQELGDHYHYTIVLHHLGCIARDDGDIVQAVALLEQCLALGRERGYVRETCIILNDLGDAACIQGDLPQATVYYWEALQLVQDEMNEYLRLPPLLNLGWLALVQGDDGCVLALVEQQVGWSQAQAVLSTLINLNPVLGALVNMHGDSVRARVILCDGLILQQQFAEQDVMIDSLEACAGVAIGQGWAVRAVRLLGAAAALRTTIGARRVSAARPAYERDVASARAQLDDASFAAAWAAGQALTLEQAIAEALAELQRTDLSTATG